MVFKEIECKYSDIGSLVGRYSKREEGQNFVSEISIYLVCI